MKERPIIFTENIPAILEGRKTQTRRVIKLDLKLVASYKDHIEAHYIKDGVAHYCDDLLSHCPYGQVGDRLWVRETWRIGGSEENGYFIEFKADNKQVTISEPAFKQFEHRWIKWNSPLFMPRWASRITLEITGVRVERVQDIKPKDCIFEGLSKADYLADIWQETILSDFAKLWDSLNTKRGYGWETNPWVWVISFKRIDNELAN